MCSIGIEDLARRCGEPEPNPPEGRNFLKIFLRIFLAGQSDVALAGSESLRSPLRWAARAQVGAQAGNADEVTAWRSEPYRTKSGYSPVGYGRRGHLAASLTSMGATAHSLCNQGGTSQAETPGTLSHLTADGRSMQQQPLNQSPV